MKRLLPVLVPGLVLLAACGGRDPLYGELLDGGPDSGAGGRDGATTTVPPVVQRDGSSGGSAGASGGARDSGSTTPPTPPPIDGCTLPRPKCITDLQTFLQTFDCTPAGACVQQFASGQVSPNVCYMNGVKILPTPSSNGRNFTLRFFGRNGRICYSIQSIQRGGGVTAFAYLDANGKEVASATVERNGTLAITCLNQPNPQSVELACQPGVSGMNRCTSGECR
jgi:hypothetical protein